MLDIILIIIILIILSIKPNKNIKYTKTKIQDNLVDSFNTNDFLKEIENKNVIICGNSPQFTESFKKVEHLPNKFIIRFNEVLDHIKPSEQTDVLFLSYGMLNKKDISNRIRKWNASKIYYIEDLYESNDVLNSYFRQDFNPMSGTILLTWLSNFKNNSKSINIVGFNLPNNHLVKSHWFSNEPVWYGHSVDLDKKIVNQIIKTNNFNIF